MTAPVPVTAEERSEAVRVEYSRYVATGPIDVNGGRAFNEGDAVPISHMENGGIFASGHPLVAKVSTKAGRAAAGIETDNTPKG